jgi:hypothetical protein
MGSTVEELSDYLPEMQITLLGPTTQGQEVDAGPIPDSTMNEELRSQLRKRLEVARHYEDPRLCTEVLVDVLDEMLKGEDSEQAKHSRLMNEQSIRCVQCQQEISAETVDDLLKKIHEHAVNCPKRTSDSQ